MEQATHFVDAMRYLSKSEIDQGSIRVVGVGPDMPLLDMAPAPAAEHTVGACCLKMDLDCNADARWQKPALLPRGSCNAARLCILLPRVTASSAEFNLVSALGDSATCSAL